MQDLAELVILSVEVWTIHLTIKVVLTWNFGLLLLPWEMLPLEHAAAGVWKLRPRKRRSVAELQPLRTRMLLLLLPDVLLLLQHPPYCWTLLLPLLLLLLLLACPSTACCLMAMMHGHSKNCGTWNKYMKLSRYKIDVYH
jgi:hypothetical protein